MNLIIDFGNSMTKVAVYNKNKQVMLKSYSNTDIKLQNHILSLLKANLEIDNVIISSVVPVPEWLDGSLTCQFKNFINLEFSTPTPVTSDYKSETLGKDRIAGVVGANNIFPATHVLVIDAGTAITYDVVTADGIHKGGNISPGLEMRFKALNNFTKQLPYLSPSDKSPFIADNTNDAIITGVQTGMLFEIDGYIANLSSQYSDLKVVFTGGNANFFASKVKNTIFVEPNLVLFGLNIILNYNVKNT